MVKNLNSYLTKQIGFKSNSDTNLINCQAYSKIKVGEREGEKDPTFFDHCKLSLGKSNLLISNSCQKKIFLMRSTIFF